MMLRMIAVLASLAVLWLAQGAQIANADDNFIVLQSTTSTKNSGLYDQILPKFTEKTGIEVRVVAVGTGQALQNARNGDGDVLLVHSKADEEAFVAEGYGVERLDVMYNDFVLIGPEGDPAKVAGKKSPAEAFGQIAKAGVPFASRGDNSGTHKKELLLWGAAGVDPKEHSGKWYREMGSGMGPTINAAVEMGAYTLTDRGTWISFKNKGTHKIVLEGDTGLFNQYAVIMISPDKHPHVRKKLAQTFVDWLVGPDGQAAIGAYRMGGKQLFFPNASDARS